VGVANTEDTQKFLFRLFLLLVLLSSLIHPSFLIYYYYHYYCYYYYYYPSSSTVHEERLVENADVFNFSLSEEDMAQIGKLGEGGRAVKQNDAPFRAGGAMVFADNAPPTVPLSYVKEN